LRPPFTYFYHDPLIPKQNNIEKMGPFDVRKVPESQKHEKTTRKYDSQCYNQIKGDRLEDFWNQ
jgi:hypothetical protein